MINIIVLLLIVGAMIYGFYTLYKKGGIYSNVVRISTGIILVVFIYLIFLGPSFRINPYSSARANAFIESEHEWLGMINLEDAEIHMFYDPNDDKYRTVLVEEYLIGYRSNIATHFYPHYEDELRTIGGINVSTDNGTYCTYMVINQISDISSIALVDKDGSIVAFTVIGVDEPVTLSYELEGRERSSDFELIAMDVEGVARYYYGYKHGDNHLSDDEYKWYAF